MDLTIKPFIAFQCKVQSSRPQFVVWIFSLEHGLEQRKSGLIEIEQCLFAIDRLQNASGAIEIVSHALQYFDIVSHFVCARDLQVNNKKQ